MRARLSLSFLSETDPSSDPTVTAPLTEHAPSTDPFRAAVTACAELYRPSGRFAHGYVRGKLLGDPVNRQLAERGPFDDPILDLGCGRGQTSLLLAILHGDQRILGFDWDEKKIEMATSCARRLSRTAELEFRAGDLRAIEYPPARTILMLDVLHYNPIDVQDTMLRRAASALQPGGRLFVRDVDAGAGWRARVNVWQERLGCWVGLNRGATLCFREAEEIGRVLESCGLSTLTVSSREGTPLANVLIEASAPD